MNHYARELARLAQTYRDAEAHIVASFFQRPRDPKDHLRWLRAQAFKEYSAIKPIFTALARLYPEIDRTIDRRQFEELTEKLADETRHARMVMDLLEEISGKKISAADLLWLPGDRKLAKVRGRYSKSYAVLLHGAGTVKAKDLRRQDEQLERAAITLTEGGGGALYQVCSRLNRNRFERKIAGIFKEILRDELEHKDAGADSLARLIKNRNSFKRAAAIVTAVSRQRLRMRNEQFGFPLSERDVNALERRVKRSAVAA
jgi:rubrerythrin